jgi:hypothetical protein
MDALRAVSAVTLVCIATCSLVQLGGRTGSWITMGLKDVVRGPNRDKLRTLACYFAARLHTFHIWAAGFYICELLNLLNVVANMFFTDKLLGGNFYEYGLQVSGSTVLC